MGKKYHCDYCNKTMVSTPSMVKTHNKGVEHQKLVQNHYQQFKDPETILAEESRKKPCSRFSRGECLFGSICRYSHYTADQINELRQIVSQKNLPKLNQNQPNLQDLYLNLQTEKSKLNISNGNTMIYDSNGVTHEFPWIYNDDFEKFSDVLPPSIRRLKLDDFSQAEFVEWG